MKQISIILLLLTIFSFSNCLNKKFQHRYQKSRHHLKHRYHSHQDVPSPIPVELPDIAHSGHHELREFLEIYRNHHMSSGEIKILFRNADRNKDNKVSFAEWADFHSLFVAPFEMIDQRGEYWLEQADLELALSPEQGEGWLDGFKLDESNNDIEFLIQQFDRFNQDNNLNFADYMFLRKANLAFKQCASEYTVGARNFPCALQITSPGRILSETDAKEVYSMAYIIQGGKLIFQNYQKGNILGETARISFVDFVGVAHLYYYFSEFSLPFDNGIINQKDVLRSIDEGVLPTTLNPKQVSEMYDGLEEMPYRGFAGLLWAQRQFNKFDADKNQKLSLDEFSQILDQPRFNPELLKLIDQLVMPTQEQIEDVAMLRIGRPANEKDYLIQFLQKNQKSHKKKARFAKKHRSHHRFHHHHRQEPVQEDTRFDDPPRTIIYRIFDMSLEEEQKYGDFANFIKYSWLFQSYDLKRRGLVNDQQIWQGTKDEISPIPLNSQEKQTVSDMGDWMGGFQHISINIKEFFIWFRYKKIFQWLKTTGMQVHAVQQKVHKGFIQLGLRLAHATENLLHDGYDQLIQEKHFHFKQMVIYALEDEVIAIKKNQDQPEE